MYVYVYVYIYVYIYIYICMYKIYIYKYVKSLNCVVNRCSNNYLKKKKENVYAPKQLNATECSI